MSAIIMNYDNDKLIIELDKDDLIKVYEDPNSYVGFVKEMSCAIIEESFYLMCKNRGFGTWKREIKFK